MNLYYIRHGQSEANINNIWSGQLDSLLTSEGRIQAKEAGDKALSEGLRFDKIYSSPLKRAYDTAVAIAEATKYPVQNIVINNDLMERSFGMLEGTSHEDAIKAYFEHESGIDEYKGVEKFADLYERAEKILASIKNSDGETILIVSHGALGRALRRHIEHLPLESKVEPYPNAKIFKLI